MKYRKLSFSDSDSEFETTGPHKSYSSKFDNFTINI